MYRTILVPLDGSPQAERALRYAEKLAAASGARLLLLRPVPQRDFATLERSEDQARGARETGAYLARMAAGVAERGRVTTVETVVFSGEASEALATVSRVRRVDLIVVAPHQTGGPGQPEGSSVTGLAHAHRSVPLLVVRPTDAEEELPLPATGVPAPVPRDPSRLSAIPLKSRPGSEPARSRRSNGKLPTRPGGRQPGR